ncbi:hypothetical protein GH714_028131 [Hevea brasiliensis]|uniref:Uncharacterized protein n=1 Tax=Hevea brasiliensis TaxID=3981 RepID=A0A6A6LBI4_HEVBR|nr:hypothetical protein GH714_028131 [Hevea brasiliensis]
MDSSSLSVRSFASAMGNSRRRGHVEDVDLLVKCYCRVPAKIWTTWKDTNPERLFFYVRNFGIDIVDV